MNLMEECELTLDMSERFGFDFSFQNVEIDLF